ncbi:TetR/AcrR family transcriptional regulator [Rikenella microfusus]
MVTSRKITAERDREATERRLVDTVGELVRENGFEKIGVNAVAARSGVSKILVYRYFGSVEGLLAAYIRRYDLWLNFPQDLPGREELPEFLKRTFRAQIARLRGDATLKRLYRWELSSDNELIVRLREQREQVGRELIRRVCDVTGRPEEQIAPLASLLSASVTYLALLGEFCPVYNGIPLQEDAGWEQIGRGIDQIVDAILKP